MGKLEIIWRLEKPEWDSRKRKVFAAVGLLPLLVCVGCRNTPRGQIENVQHDNQRSARAANSVPAPREMQPQTFGFDVSSVQKESCCSDVPGKPHPDGLLTVQGITPDNWRFLLSCVPSEFIKTDSGYRRATREDWFQGHTASIEHERYGDMMTLYNLSADPVKGLKWTEWVTCSVINRLDRANDMSAIQVTVSEFRHQTDGDGYEISAFSAHERFTLDCVEGTQSPCVSIAPGAYWGVRDSSEMRICDGQIKVVCTCRIMREQAYR